MAWCHPRRFSVGGDSLTSCRPRVRLRGANDLKAMTTSLRYRRTEENILRVIMQHPCVLINPTVRPSEHHTRQNQLSPCEGFA
jgi:hypothetical protein